MGLIHGAGLIKDKLIREKTPESFDRVLGTKVDGAQPGPAPAIPSPCDSRRSSRRSPVGSATSGQSDYAAANELLNKLALWLDRRWPGRVVSLIWGPWSGVGMVSQLEEHLGRRGLGMIAPEAGRSLLLDELRLGRKGDVEVIYTGGLGTLENPLPIGTPAEIFAMSAGNRFDIAIVGMACRLPGAPICPRTGGICWTAGLRTRG